MFIDGRDLDETYEMTLGPVGVLAADELGFVQVAN